MDGGDILLQKRVDIDPGASAPAVYEQVCEATVDLVLEALPLLRDGMTNRVPQDHKESTYTCSRAPQDGYIDWSAPTNQIYNKIRALAHPYPGAFTYYKGQKLTIWDAILPPDPRRYIGRVPGKLVSIDTSEGFVDVLTGDSVIRLLRVQLEGGPPMRASQVLRSVRDSLGVTATELVDRVRTLEEQVSHLLRILGDGHS
jgi:methionyl-tRNA formyltransferase